VSYWQTWFKDAFPAGESRTVRFHSAADTDLSHQIKRSQAPEPLAPMLAHKPKNPGAIAKILERRNNNDTTKFLRMYLTATDARVVQSAAEVVIENIFYGDRSAQAKCVEIGNDFEAIMQYGYFDQSVASRREYLQARLDQVYTRAQQPKDALEKAIVYVGAPIVISSIFGVTGRVVEHVAESTSALRAGNVIGRGAAARLSTGLAVRADSLLERAMLKTAQNSENMINAFLAQRNFTMKIPFYGTTRGALRKQLALSAEELDAKWIPARDNMLRYFRTRQDKGVDIAHGAEMLVFELKDGVKVRYATSNYLNPDALDEAEKLLANLPRPTVMAMDQAGHTTPTDIRAVEINTAAQAPRAFRLDDASPSAPKMTEESGEILDAVPGGSITTPPVDGPAPAKRRWVNRANAGVGFTAGLLSIMGVYKLGEITGREGEMNINALYLGGEIGNSAKVPPKLKTGRTE
jgi:hypothetical protein